MKNKALPIIFIVVAVLMLIRSLVPQRSDSLFPVTSFAELPVLEGGRYKPLDSFARTSMLLLRGKQTALNSSGEKIPAIEWLMELTLQPERASTYPVFLINHDDIKELIGAENLKDKHFSYAQIIPHVEKIQERMKRIPAQVQRQNPAEKELAKLYNNLVLYQRVAFSFRGPILQETVVGEYQFYLQTLKRAAAKVSANEAIPSDDPTMAKVSSYMRMFSSVSDHRSAKFVPSVMESGEWLNLSESLMASMQMGEIPQVTMLFGKLADAYASGDVEQFRSVLDAIHQEYADVKAQYPSDKIAAEVFVNSVQPFGTAMALYVWVFMGVLIAWLLMDDRMLKWVFWLAIVACLLHSGGLLARMIIQGRPPVTNLYSSAVFVGWGAVVLGMLLEKIYKNGLGSAVSSIIGFITLIVANHLMASGDTMEMMRAVLDSNFWLATHVVTVSLGYSATYFAGFLAVLYFFLGIFTPKLDAKLKASLVRMVYGIVCFSLLFSFVGTVLGGIWADQSWGRFWGWDPKENGALMIVIWNALVLHAKRGGIVRSVGFMNLAIFGNIITSWSWFGTNMLGVGLHSYGFMGAAFMWLLGFCLLHILVILVGAYLPKQKWRSRS